MGETRRLAMRGWNTAATAITVGATALLSLATARAEPPVDDMVPPPSGQIGAGDLGEQRELSAVDLRLNPPRLTGDKTDLRVDRGKLTGQIQGASFTAS